MAPRWPVRTAAAKRPVRGQDALLRYHAKMSKSLSFCFLMSFSNLELCQLVLTSLTEENTKTPCWTKVRNGEFSEKRKKKNASICESLQSHMVPNMGWFVNCLKVNGWACLQNPRGSLWIAHVHPFLIHFSKKKTAQCLEGLQIVTKPMLRKWAFHEGIFCAIMGGILATQSYYHQKEAEKS